MLSSVYCTVPNAHELFIGHIRQKYYRKGNKPSLLFLLANEKILRFLFRRRPAHTHAASPVSLHLLRFNARNFSKGAKIPRFRSRTGEPLAALVALFMIAGSTGDAGSPLFPFARVAAARFAYAFHDSRSTEMRRQKRAAACGVRAAASSLLAAFVRSFV